MGEVIQIDRSPIGRVNYMTQRNAEQLARRIENFWHSAGYHTAKVYAVRREYILPSGEVDAAYDVRSNLIGGLPPR